MSEILDYFNEVAAANAKAAIEQPGSRRQAINTILTLDGFFGTLHSELFKIGLVTEKTDDVWKETLASGCHHYRVLRDTAYSLKHGSLTHPKSRLVRRSDQVLSLPAAFDRARFDIGSFDTETVWIEASDTDYRADEVIRSVVELARTWLAKVPS
jgi:hypothetical protein